MSQHWLSKAGLIVGLAAAFFTLNAVAFDSEVDRKIGDAQRLQVQHSGAILHHVVLLSQRQTVEGIRAQVRLEEFMQAWYAAELRRESDSGRVYELHRLSENSLKRTQWLRDRLRHAQERLDELEATSPPPCCPSTFSPATAHRFSPRLLQASTAVEGRYSGS